MDHHRADYVVVNVENSAGGFGVTPDVLAEIATLPIDVFTTGNHVWDKKEGIAILDHERRLLRPHNYPAGNPGTGLHVGETAAGIPVAVIRGVDAKWLRDASVAAEIVRAPHEDLFR